MLREASLLEIEDILTGYSDVSSERVTIELETGRTVLLELSFAELPQTKVRAAAMGNDVLLLGYISREFIDPLGFMRAEPPNEDDVWSFEIDGDGDLSYSAVFTPVSKEDMETMVIAHLVLLQMRVQPYLDDLTAVPVEDENAFDVAGCAEGVERAWVGMPQEMVAEFNAWEYCTCLKDKVSADPTLISAMLNLSSPEGKALIASCWASFVPNHEELGLTVDMVFEATNPEQIEASNKKAFVRGCVREIMEDPEVYNDQLTYGAVEECCSCRFEAMSVRDDLSWEEMADPASDMAIEIAAECIHLIEDQSPAGWNADVSVEGCTREQHIPLLWDGSGYQMRLNLGGVTKYIVMDTGASEVVISRDWFNELSSEGAELNYKGAEFLQMADGSPARVERYTVPYLTIGDCTFRDFEVGVMQEGGMLCGMGLLGLFDSWSVNTGDAELILRH